jgi:hypothetical protein
MFRSISHFFGVFIGVFAAPFLVIAFLGFLGGAFNEDNRKDDPWGTEEPRLQNRMEKEDKKPTFWGERKDYIAAKKTQEEKK